MRSHHPRLSTAILAVVAMTLPGVLVAPTVVRDDRAAVPAPTPAQQRAGKAYGKLPLSFEPNQGQADSRVAFSSRGAGYSVMLTHGEAVITLSGRRNVPASAGDAEAAEKVPNVALTITPVGANPQAEIVAHRRLPGVVNHLIGPDPSRWQRDVPTYAEVAYRGAYPGIDLVYHGNQGQLEHDFVVSPGADPNLIAMRFDGHRGMRVSKAGDLVFDTAAGELRQSPPRSYQGTGSTRRLVASRYEVKNDTTVGFALGTYDRTRELVIDPVLAYSTFLGGSNFDSARGVAVDALGNAYVAGTTSSPDFPASAGAYDTTCGSDGFCNRIATGWPPPDDFSYSSDAFVAKLNPQGSALVYATYLGGASTPASPASGNDQGTALAVDSSGSAWVTGWTRSPRFPTTDGALDRTCGTDGSCNPQDAYNFVSDAFVSKLDPTGSQLAYSTYLGGPSDEYANGIAVNPANQAVVVGQTSSATFPVTAGAYDETCGLDGACDPKSVGGGNLVPDSDAFAAVFSPVGSLIYSTFLGGGLSETAYGASFGPTGDIFVVGGTESPTFPTTLNGFQTACPCGAAAFVTRLHPAGNRQADLAYSSLLGGTLPAVYAPFPPSAGGSYQVARGVAIGGDGHAYVVGVTSANDFPTTPDAVQVTKGSPLYADAFVAEFDTNAALGPRSLVYSTYFGGINHDSFAAIAVGSGRIVHLTGATSSPNFPVSSDALEPSKPDSFQTAFVTKLNLDRPGRLGLVYSTYLGTAQYDDEGWGIALDPVGNAYVTGQTESGGFPTTECALQRTKGGFANAFVTKFDYAGVAPPRSADVSITMSDAPDPTMVGGQLTYTLTVANAGPDRADEVVITDDLPAGVTYRSSQGNCEYAAGTVTCRLGSVARGEVFSLSIAVTPDRSGSITNVATVQASGNDPATANNQASATTTVRDTADLSVSMTDSPDPVNVGQQLTYTLAVTNGGPSAASAVTLTDTLPAGVKFVSATADQGSCTYSEATVTCALGGLAAGATTRARIVVKPTRAGTITNSAVVSGAEGDPNSVDNTAGATTKVTKP